MRDVTEVKGLSELRTAIIARVHSKPRQGGTTHVDLYLLSKGKQRLEKELPNLQRRQNHIQEHLAEIHQVMGRLKQEAEQEESGQTNRGARKKPSAGQYGQRQWKKMTLNY